MIAGLVSFPIYTRLLSVSDYGRLGLVMTTVLLVVALGKLGIQHSVVRYYSDFSSEAEVQSRSTFYSTFFLSIIVIGGLLCFLFFLTLRFAGDWLMEENLKHILLLTSILIFFNCYSQTINQVFRAEQKPVAYNLLALSSRYGHILFGTIFFILFGRVLYSFFGGVVFMESILFVVLSYMFLRTRAIGLRYYSFSLLKNSLKYGLPLIGVELSHLILSFGDRYIIQYYLGATSLGIYSAGYGLATYGAEFVTLPVRDAIIPIYMDIYAKRGDKETRVFLGKALRYFSVLAIPVIFGFTAISSELIVLLASSKYAQSYMVVPYVIGGIILYGTWPFFGAGILLHKRTSIMTGLVIISSMLNIILNFVLVPRINIIGAAIATLISYAFYIGMLIIFSFKRFKFRIDYGRICLYSVLSYFMYLGVREISLKNLWINLAIKIITGVLIYLVLVVIFDKEIRLDGARIIGKYRNKEKLGEIVAQIREGG